MNEKKTASIPKKTTVMMVKEEDDQESHILSFDRDQEEYQE